MSKYSKEFVEFASNKIWQVLDNKSEQRVDWTQICLSMRDAVQAAADIWGMSSDEDIVKLHRFFQELVIKEIDNVYKYDITYRERVDGD